MSILKELLSHAIAKEASDVHIKADHEPFLRVGSVLEPSGFSETDEASMTQVLGEIIPVEHQERFRAEHEVDFSHYEDGVGRFRVNIFVAQGAPAIAMRYVRDDIPTIDSLNLPENLHSLSKTPRGIILMAGTTGSGKSTTLAAIIGEINRNSRRRIITIEDPIEYAFKDDLSFISQREVGLDTVDFSVALKHVLRQDPDVILIGEMRDTETIRTALLAAETGHLVLSTLHASSASIAVPRLLDVFAEAEQDHIRKALATNLAGIICQRLIPSLDGGVIPAAEIMFNTPTVRKLISRGQLDVLEAAIETGVEDGMQSFDQAIYNLISDGFIAEEEGMLHATNPESLRMNLQGIFLDESRRILGG